MSEPTRLLGIDHGRKRIGLALSDPLGIVASPLTVITVSRQPSPLHHIAQLAAEHNIASVVIGLPTDSEGLIGPQARLVIQWARKLAPHLNMPIVMWDESYSTEDALAHTRGSRRRKKRDKANLDAIAAAVILQSYLEARQYEDEPGQPLQAIEDQA